MPSLNEEVRDLVIRHMIYLEGVKNHIEKSALSFLDKKIIPDLIDELRIRLAKFERLGYDTGAKTTKRLEDMIASFAEITGRYGDFQEKLESDLIELANDEAKWQGKILNDQTPVKVEYIIPPAAKISQVVKNKPFDGRTLSGWFENLSATTQERLAVAIRQGVVEGQTVEQIVRRVQGSKSLGYTDGILQTTRAQTRAVVHSAVQHASNAARQDLFTENAEYLNGVQWVATLDSHTCLICAPLDGKVYPVNEGKRPPIHTRCRCTIIPVTKSWKELGLDFEDIAPEMRASMNGQVPASTTYGEWLKSQPKEFQIEVLGHTRAALFRKGDLSISSFTNNSGHQLTIQELRVKDPAAFKKASL